MATQIIKSNETSHVQEPMHHRTYTSTEAMTTAQVTVQSFYAICIFKLQATQISTVTSQSFIIY